MLTQGYQAMIN